jgi:hypothetical protein
MKGLVAKVKRGVYDSIPKLYSADLSLIISEMLKVIFIFQYLLFNR